MTKIIPAADPAALSMAVDLLLQDELVALPTETVYGLAGRSVSETAIARIYSAKNRPATNPLISHIADMEMAMRYVRFDPLSRQLAEAFWPGPMTLILPLREGGIHRSSTAGGNLAAIRMPEGFARQIIAKLDQPLAAPSANSSGRISPTSAAHVAVDMGGRIALIIDGGTTRLGLESTVLRADHSGITLLRPGALTAETIAEATGIFPVSGAGGDSARHSPGTMSSHYAPRAAVRLDATHVDPGEAVLRFGTTSPAGIEFAAAVFDLSPDGDLAQAARRLFDLLHKADNSGAKSIAVTPIPREGIGQAINDRLERAAAPRPRRL